MAKKIKIVEVGLRDGLQNEKSIVSQESRLVIAEKLVQAGLKNIEIGSFVSPKWVPQMAGSLELVQKCFKSSIIKPNLNKISLSALVPNERGMMDAVESGVKEIAIFASCSEAFSQKNINCSIEESYQRFMPVMKLAKKHKIKVRGYLSCCFGCPFEGKVSEKVVIESIKRMFKMGCYEVSIGDTIGVAHAGQIESFKKLKRSVKLSKVAGHFHNTKGQALANIYAAIKIGVTTFDSSVGGLGGCPYANGATGNVATEDVVYMLHGLGYQTGIDLKKLIDMQPTLQIAVDHELSVSVKKV